MQLPETIYYNKKSIRARIKAYAFLMLFFIWGFWYGTGKFFTANEYYPQMVLLMPICIIAMLVLVVQEYQKLRNDGPLVELTREGVRIYGKYFDEIGTVRWKDITGCSEFASGWWVSNTYLGIDVLDPAQYYDKIQNSSLRRKFKRLRKKRKNSLLWLNAVYLCCDRVEFKRTIYQSIEKQKDIYNQTTIHT